MALKIHYKRILPFIITFSAILAIYFVVKLFHIQLNLTSSMPIGFYQQVHTSNLHRDDIVSVCLPKKIVVEGKNRGYLVSGKCPGNTISVLKELIALPHDNVRLTLQAIIVNGIFYNAPHSMKDHANHLIRQFVAYGIYQNINDYWLYGANDPKRSWDSRYYGGVPLSTIQGIYKPLFTYRMKSIR